MQTHQGGNMNRETKYQTVSDIAKNPKYPFTEPMLRHHLLHRHKNGLNKAVSKTGKRLVIRSDLFDAWIENQLGRQ